MDKRTLFLIGLVLLGIFVIVDALWIFSTPPINDEPQAFCFVAIGVFMILIGYEISKRN